MSPKSSCGSNFFRTSLHTVVSASAPSPSPHPFTQPTPNQPSSSDNTNNDNASPHRTRNPNPLLKTSKLHGPLHQEPHRPTAVGPLHFPPPLRRTHELPARESKQSLLLLRAPREPIYLRRARELAFGGDVSGYVGYLFSGVKRIQRRTEGKEGFCSQSNCWLFG